jgi:hypothetical protein
MDELFDHSASLLFRLGYKNPKTEISFNVLPIVGQVPEVCHNYPATANPLEVFLAETEQKRGILAEKVVSNPAPSGGVLMTHGLTFPYSAWSNPLGWSRWMTA